MTDPVISPDGKFMWIEEKWVPLQQSTAEDNPIIQSNAISDSVVMGDVVNIVNKPKDIVEAISNRVCVFCKTSGNLTFFACKSPVCDERYCNYCSEASSFCPECKILETRMIQINRDINTYESVWNHYLKDIDYCVQHQKKLDDHAELKSKIKQLQPVYYRNIFLSILIFPFAFLALIASFSIPIFSLTVLLLLVFEIYLMSQISPLEKELKKLKLKSVRCLPTLYDKRNNDVCKSRISDFEKSSKEATIQSIKSFYSKKLEIISKLYEPKIKANVLISYGKMMDGIDRTIAKECFLKAVQIQRGENIPIEKWLIELGF